MLIVQFRGLMITIWTQIMINFSALLLTGLAGLLYLSRLREMLSHLLIVLGDTLDSNLQYDTHISNLCSKASTQINAMKRIGKYLNTDCRIAMYKSFISSNFSYCPVSWMFCGKRNSDKLEKLLERALHFVFSDYTSPYSNLLKRGNFLSLSAFRIRYLGIEMYKCVHDLNPPYLNELFVSKDTRYNLRDSNRLQQPEFQTVRYGFKSFHY